MCEQGERQRETKREPQADSTLGPEPQRADPMALEISGQRSGPYTKSSQTLNRWSHPVGLIFFKCNLKLIFLRYNFKCIFKVNHTLF